MSHVWRSLMLTFRLELGAQEEESAPDANSALLRSAASGRMLSEILPSSSGSSTRLSSAASPHQTQTDHVDRAECSKTWEVAKKPLSGVNVQCAQ